MAVPKVNAEYLKDIEKARRELHDLIRKHDCAPTMLRLAFHDAATYDAGTKKGGPNGSIKNYKNLDDDLYKAIQWCDGVKKQCPKITYADLYQLAGVVAVEITRGPSIDFAPGRPDSLDSPAEDEGRLPHAQEVADGESLRNAFNRMGLTDKDIVALSGANCLGEVKIFGFKGAGTTDPWKFDNSYFQKLREERPSPDKVLVEAQKFNKYVDQYEKDKEVFFKDYAASHKKLSELGFTPPSSSTEGSDTPSSSHVGGFKSRTLIASAVGIAVTATVAFFVHRYRLFRRTKTESPEQSHSNI